MAQLPTTRTLIAAPADTPDSAAASTMSSARSRLASATLSIESAIWLVLLVMSGWSRFWELGSREFHHDESLHVYYSWEWIDGAISYTHFPLSHGPLLFHLNALVYLFLGESNTTSRLVPAFVGVLIVAVPWLLRGHAFLGRWGALAAGFMLAISPSMLYYTRFIRHDPYTVFLSLLLCVAIFRYLERPQRRWMMTAFVSVGLLATNHEIFFAILLGMVMVLWGALLVTRLRALIPVHLAALAGLFVIFTLHRIRNWAPLPAIPWRNATDAQTRHFYALVFENPFVLSILVLGAVFVVACIIVGIFEARARRSRADELTSDVLFGESEPHSIAYGVLHAWRDLFGVAIGALVALFICLTLFTSLYTNPNGIATATYAPNGTLLYWLGQQGERRGDQPWFYFITEGIQYEWLAIVLGGAGMVFTLVRVWGSFRGQRYVRSSLFLAFLAFWTVFMFVVLSWAGEKMPWLIMYIVSPAALLGGVVVDQAVSGAGAAWRNRTVRPSRTSRAGPIALGCALVTLAFAAFYQLARLTANGWIDQGTNFWVRRIPQASVDDWWILAIGPLAAILILSLGMVTLGMRRTAHAALVAAFLVMSLFQVHAGFRVSFLDGAGARDTLIYNTVGADVMQMRDDVAAVSRLAYGDLSMPVIYDNCTAWPLNVDLNDMPNASQRADVDVAGADRPPVVIGGTPFGNCDPFPNEIDGYTRQDYMFRWHESENAVYRNFAIAPELEPSSSIWGTANNPHDLAAIFRSCWNSAMTLADPEGQQRAFRLLMFRETGQPVQAYIFHVFIRDDYLPYYNQVRYGT